MSYNYSTQSWWPSVSPWSTQQWFKDRILEVDSLAEVDFEKINMGVWIRPSHPCYRDGIIRCAWLHKCIGVLIVVVKEVDEPVYYTPDGEQYHEPVTPVPLQKSLFVRWFRKLFKASK